MSDHFKIEYKKKIIPDAYHATDYRSHFKILRNGWEIIRNPENFLGDGVYFWEGSLRLAKWWGNKVAKEKGQDRCVIFVASIDLGVCLDLTMPEHIDVLRALAGQLHSMRDEKITDPLLINYFCDNICKEVQTVRGIFRGPGAKRPFDHSRLVAVQMIICVRQVQNITSTEIYEQ